MAGDAEILVGCEHRLGLMVGDLAMREPCPACQGSTPRYAIAMYDTPRRVDEATRVAVNRERALRGRS